jgi:ABC-type polar amino acid transport system ATPase subunit
MDGLARDGMTMMCVAHEMGFARRVANRIVFMDGGETLEDCPAAAFFQDPRTERARNFLGKILRH